MSKSRLQTTWFERHRSTPINDIANHWPEDYQRLVERRIALIESDRYIGLIERPEYKRRWNQEPWEEQEKRVLQNWLLDRLETDRYWDEIDAQVASELTPISGETDYDYQKRLQAEQRQQKKAQLGTIAPPPKYRSADFLSSTYW